MATREFRPLGVGPPLEHFGVVTEVEAVEEGTPIQLHGLRGPPFRQGQLEGGRVAADQGRIEPKLGTAGHGLRPQLAAEHEHGLFQEVAGARLVALGPQGRQEALPGHASAWRAGEEREQRQAVSLGRRPGDRDSVALERAAAQQLEVHHVYC